MSQSLPSFGEPRSFGLARLGPRLSLQEHPASCRSHRPLLEASCLLSKENASYLFREIELHAKGRSADLAPSPAAEPALSGAAPASAARSSDQRCDQGWTKDLLGAARKRLDCSLNAAAESVRRLTTLPPALAKYCSTSLLLALQAIALLASRSMVTDMQESAAGTGRNIAEPTIGPSKSSTCRLPCNLRPAALDIPEHDMLADSDRPAAMSIQSIMQGWTEEWSQDQPTSLPSLPVPPLHEFKAIPKLHCYRALCLDALDCVTALQAQTSLHRPPTLEPPCIASYSQNEASIMTGLLSLGTQCCLHYPSTTIMDMSVPSSSFEKRVIMPTLVLNGTSIRSLPIPSVPTATFNGFDMTYVLQLAEKQSPQASVSLYNTLMTSSVTLRDKLERCLPEPPVQVTSQRLRLLQVVIDREVPLADTDTTGNQRDRSQKEGQVPLLTAGIPPSLVPLPDNQTLPAVSSRPCAGLEKGVEASQARRLPAPTMSSELSFYIRTRHRLPCDLNCETLKHCIEEQKGVELHLIRPSDSLCQILDAMKEDYTRIEGVWGPQEGSSHHFGLDAQGTAALRAKIEGMAQGVARTQLPALRSLVAMHTLRQAARALADYGIRVAHLYLEQALHRMTFLEAAATRCRTRLTLAFEEVESGLLEDHPKLASLMQTLRGSLELQGRAGHTLATLIILEQRGFFTLFSPLLSLGLRAYQVDKEGLFLHNGAFDKAMTNALDDMIEQILTVADCLLLPEAYITESFKWQCFSIVVLYASEASKEVLEALKHTQCTVHHFKMEIDSSRLGKCDRTERLPPGPHEPPLIASGKFGQQLEKESCWNAPMVCPTSKQAGDHCDMILVVNFSRTGSQPGSRTGRWLLRDHLLKWEADNVQVIERELLLPLDIILSPTAAFTLYTEEKLEVDARPLTKSSTNYVETIVDDHLRAISCAYDLVILVFEGTWRFTSRMLNVLDDLYAAALGLDIQLQCFLSDTEEQTGELVTECINAVRLSSASSYPAMSESPTLAEDFLNRFPALNTLSGHCILSAGIPLPVFMCLSTAQQAAAVSQFKVSKRALDLYRMQCQQIVDIGSSSVPWDATGITYGQGHVPGGREQVSNTRQEVAWRRPEEGREQVSNTRQEVDWRRPEEGLQEQYCCNGSSVHRLHRRSSGALEKVIDEGRASCPQSFTRDELEDQDIAMHMSSEIFETNTGRETEQPQDMSMKGALRQWLASKKQGLQQTRVKKARVMSKVQPTNIEAKMAPSRRRWLEEECHTGAVQDPFFDQTADDGHDSTFNPSENSQRSPLDSLGVTSVDNALKSWIAARRTDCKVQKQVSKRPRHSAIPALQRRVQQRLEKSAAKSGLADVDIYQLCAERSSENGRQLQLPEFEQWRHNALHTVWEDSNSKITQQRRSGSSSNSSDSWQDLQSWTPLDKRAKQELGYDRRGKKGQQSKLVWTEPQYLPQNPLGDIKLDL